MRSKNENRKTCSFCGKAADYTRRLIAGPGVYICNDCVKSCNDILEDEMGIQQNGEIEQQKTEDLPTPKEMKEYLDNYIVGQDQAKRVLSVAVYNHYKRIFSGTKLAEDVEVEKSNVLLVGPTGTGKTLIARTLAKKLHVPFAIADATTLTEAGYVGEDVENILLKLIQSANGDIKSAERGIIYVDEIDKIGRKGENASITRDVSGEGVQQALLKIIEGTVASVPPQGGRKHPNQDMLKIDTSNILFICGGAFVGLDRLIEERVKDASMGFGADVKSKEKKDLASIYQKMHPDDLIKFGLIPEFIGRLPIHVYLNELTKDDLIRIITEPKNAIVKQYKALLELDNVELDFEEEAIEAIASLAIERKTGARGLRSIIENIMMDIMFEIPSIKGEKHIVIDKDVIDGVKKPEISNSKKSA